MDCPRINGQGKKRKSYQHTAVEYSHKRDVINYNEEGHDLDETIAHFYGELNDVAIRAKKKQINKWVKLFVLRVNRAAAVTKIYVVLVTQPYSPRWPKSPLSFG